MYLAGCKKKETPPKAAQVHSITREMLRVAASFNHETLRTDSKLDFDAAHPNRADHIRITLPNPAPRQLQLDTAARLTQALDRVASANQLTRDPVDPASFPARLQYHRAGALTHVIEIFPASVLSAPSAGSGPRLAIILDDLGNDRSAAESIFALPYPVTISILPNHPHSAEIAEEAHRRGFSVMLHLPMQSLGNEKPEPQELCPGMSQHDLTVLFDRLLASVPNVSGVNNHQGSQSTADSALMHELMPVLREHHLFYIDSRTTAATVAFDTAQHDGVPSAFRNVPFLDDVVEVGAVRKQVQLALRDARKKGEAIAIGHAHRATLAALREVLPQAKSSGVTLVPASDLVH